MGNISQGELRTDDLKYLPEGHSEFPSLLLAPGDVLFNRTNSAELVGKSAVYRGDPSPCSFASYLIRVRMVPDGLDPEFLVYYLSSSFGRSWLATAASQQVGQANVNATKLRALAVPLPPREEQLAIVKVVRACLTGVELLGIELRQLLDEANQLDRSLLRAGAQGLLVAQSESNEPASAMIARIKEGRAERDLKAKADRSRAGKTAGARAGAKS
jgi:type I restriction enzyme S subunit